MFLFFAVALLIVSWAVFWGGAFRLAYGRWPRSISEWTPR